VEVTVVGAASRPASAARGARPDDLLHARQQLLGGAATSTLGEELHLERADHHHVLHRHDVLGDEGRHEGPVALHVEEVLVVITVRARSVVGDSDEAPRDRRVSLVVQEIEAEVGVAPAAM